MSGLGCEHQKIYDKSTSLVLKILASSKNTQKVWLIKKEWRCIDGVQKSSRLPVEAAAPLSDSLARLLLIIDTFSAFLDYWSSRSISYSTSNAFLGRLPSILEEDFDFFARAADLPYSSSSS